MASNSEYEQQRMWPEQNVKPASSILDFAFGDFRQSMINYEIYMTEQERKYWFQTVTGISGAEVNIIFDKTSES